MKRLLIPLLATLALPTAVKAESVYLLVNIADRYGAAVNDSSSFNTGITIDICISVI